MSAALRRPSGRSHNTCSATVGHTPVSACTCPASLNFSSSVEAAAACRNLPNRVPVFANPHDGSSIRKPSSALWTRVSCDVIGSPYLELAASDSRRGLRGHADLPIRNPALLLQAVLAWPVFGRRLARWGKTRNTSAASIGGVCVPGLTPPRAARSAARGHGHSRESPRNPRPATGATHA